MMPINIKYLNDLNKTFKNIDAKETQNLKNEIYDKFTQSRKVEDETLERSCKLSLTIKSIAEKNNAIGGTGSVVQGGTAYSVRICLPSTVWSRCATTSF